MKHVPQADPGPFTYEGSREEADTFIKQLMDNRYWFEANYDRGKALWVVVCGAGPRDPTMYFKSKRR